jgi:hypothetical protein
MARPAQLLGGHEVGALENPDVLLDPVERQSKRLGELADRGGGMAQPFEDLATCRVGERKEGPVECRR